MFTDPLKMKELPPPPSPLPPLRPTRWMATPVSIILTWTLSPMNGPPFPCIFCIFSEIFLYFFWRGSSFLYLIGHLAADVYEGRLLKDRGSIEKKPPQKNKIKWSTRHKLFKIILNWIKIYEFLEGTGGWNVRWVIAIWWTLSRRGGSEIEVNWRVTWDGNVAWGST